MKTTCLILTFAALSATPALSQGGSLTPPPGAPEPTMKTLDQVEPRIPLVEGSPGVNIFPNGGIEIAQPGSYYLTKNQVKSNSGDAIIITASQVTLDLMGHSIIYQGSGNASAAIGLTQNLSNINIKNGHILSTTTHNGSSFVTSGFLNGIISVDSTTNITVENISIKGVRNNGINADGSGSIVRNCSVSIAGNSGILGSQAIVESCSVHLTGGIGISARNVINCSAELTTNIAIDANVVVNSYAVSSGQDAIFSLHVVANSFGVSLSTNSSSMGINSPRGSVIASFGESEGGHGIRGVTVSQSHGESRGSNGLSSSGIKADSVGTSYGSNNFSSGGRGIDALTVNNCVGDSANLQGIYSELGSVNGSFGRSFGTSANAKGIQAQIVSDSRGQSINAGGGEGIRADTLAMNCVAQSSGTSALYATRAATNCYGFTNATNASAHGIFSEGPVNNSYGWSNGNGGGDGINATIVTGSYGNTATGARHGINARIVNSSYGRRASGVGGKFGILANRASLSEAVNGESITHKYDMP